MFNNRSFLYVEDDPMSREAMDLILKRVLQAGQVTVFENSSNFLERVRSLPYEPDIVLLDIHMEPLTGFEMLEVLRAEPAYQDAKIIALTASVMNDEVTLLRTSGFDGAIGKPINVATFPDTIQAILDGVDIWHISDLV
jgi:CheY-like chemotaxis protein